MCLFPIKILNKRKYSAIQSLLDIELDLQSAVDLLKDEPTYMYVPCGHCFECQMQVSNDWSYRCALEAEKHKENCFLTLTYKETNGELCKRDIQLFLKRLRDAIKPIKIRYFGCGEYGSKGKRPHFHLNIFGWSPKDLKVFKYDCGEPVYISDFVSKIWKNGYITVQEFNQNTAKYSSLYMQKSLKFDEMDKKVKPFRLMSRRPAIGADCFDRINFDTDKIYLNGSYIRIPRYFINKALKEGIADITTVQVERERQKQQVLSNPEAYGLSLKSRNDKAKKFFDKFYKKS